MCPPAAPFWAGRDVARSWGSSTGSHDPSPPLPVLQRTSTPSFSPRKAVVTGDPRDWPQAAWVRRPLRPGACPYQALSQACMLRLYQFSQPVCGAIMTAPVLLLRILGLQEIICSRSLANEKQTLGQTLKQHSLYSTKGAGTVNSQEYSQQLALCWSPC